MARALLTSFFIRGFRGIQTLDVRNLGRTNLIVGRNSCGKTSILEALRLYTSRASWSSIAGVLTNRNDVVRIRFRDPDQLTELHDSLRNLFYAGVGALPTTEISLGSFDENREDVSIGLARFRSEIDEDGRQLKLIDEPVDPSSQDGIGLVVRSASKSRAYPFDMDRYISPALREFDDPAAESCISVSTAGMSEDQMGRYWDRITLTESEDEVVEALRIIAPELERISLVQTTGRDRAFMVRLKGYARPMPLRIMGDGLSRVMGIALALVSAKNGVLVIDEIENGLHYSVQPKVWDLITRTAKRLNVQVFAATHSWDCVDAFQKASSLDKVEDAMLFRAEASFGSLRMIPFTESELEIAARDGIEVR